MPLWGWHPIQKVSPPSPSSIVARTTTEEASGMNKAAEILYLARNGKLRVGDRPRCPTCNTPNFCRHHLYAYTRWLERTKPYLELEAAVR
jgi:hypothetical protein